MVKWSSKHELMKRPRFIYFTFEQFIIEINLLIELKRIIRSKFLSGCTCFFYSFIHFKCLYCSETTMVEILKNKNEEKIIGIKCGSKNTIWFISNSIKSKQ